MRTQLRTVIVVALTALFVVDTLPDIALPWHPWASYGMISARISRTEATIDHVDPGGPAARAGVRAGDRIELTHMPLNDRRSLSLPFNAEAAGTIAHFDIRHGSESRVVTLIATPHLRTLADNVADVLQVLSETGFPIIAMFLLLARPAVLTWAFFIYSLANSGSVLADTYVPTGVQLLELAWTGAVEAAGTGAFVIFALRFPSNTSKGWKRNVERVVLCVIPLFVVAGIYAQVGQAVLAPGFLQVFAACEWDLAVGYFVGAAAFIATLVHATPQERPRVLWVILGFIVGYGGLAILLLIQSDSIPVWLNDALQTLNIFVPITVMYAILKHRVIDVRFFLNRALVYGLLTTVGVGLLVLLDFAVAKRLESYGVVIEIAGALALGIGIQHLHRFIDALVDRYVFRSVHEAERHLQRTREAMMYAESLAAIDAMLTNESARALRLRSVAVFRRDHEEIFRREAALGWGEGTAVMLTADDPLVLDLQAQKRGVAEGPFLSEHTGFPPDVDAPAFAVPICIRERVVGIALFGAHVNASDIDPDEQRILEGFVARASIAYDHVSSLERAAENARMRIELDFLRGLVRPILPPANVSE